MRYKVSRTYIDKVGNESKMVREKSARIIEAKSAVAAATLFIADETCRLVGEIQLLPGDEATASCQSGGQMFVITAVRDEVVVTGS
jgi:hypothetical protein